MWVPCATAVASGSFLRSLRTRDRLSAASRAGNVAATGSDVRDMVDLPQTVGRTFLSAPNDNWTGNVRRNETSSTRSGFLQSPDVHLVHLQHGLHHSFGFLCVLALHELAEHGGTDLPRLAELVPPPAAPFLDAARRRLLPQPVHLWLRLAAHEKRDGRREREMRPAVEGHETLPLELEGRRHHRPLRARGVRRVTGDIDDLGVLENRDVEVHRLFGLAVE